MYKRRTGLPDSGLTGTAREALKKNAGKILAGK